MLDVYCKVSLHTYFLTLQFIVLDECNRKSIITLIAALRGNYINTKIYCIKKLAVFIPNLKHFKHRRAFLKALKIVVVN